MSRAEKFIQDYTRNCSNYSSYAMDTEPWLTPDQARRAVEIAREEMIEKACKFVKEHFFFEEDSEWMLEGERELTKKDKAIHDLKQAMKDE